MPCRFGYRRYDAFRSNLKSMKILASGSQPNAVFGLGTGVTMLPDWIWSWWRYWNVVSEFEALFGLSASADCLVALRSSPSGASFGLSGWTGYLVAFLFIRSRDWYRRSLIFKKYPENLSRIVISLARIRWDILLIIHFEIVGVPRPWDDRPIEVFELICSWPQSFSYSIWAFPVWRQFPLLGGFWDFCFP